jgi:putative hydrolase of the HAD superfamily
MFPEAICFDLDDTIIAFEAVTQIAWQRVCHAFVQKNPIFDEQALLGSISAMSAWYWSDPERHRIGRLNMAATRRMLVKTALEKLGCRDESFAVEIADRYTELRTELIHVIPGAKETLEQLAQRNIHLALITNGAVREQRAKIERFDLAKYFQAILIEEEVGIGKPDERVFQLCLNKLQLTADQVWMVGDNLEWDVAAPQRVGIYAIWNDYRRRGLPPDSRVKPDRIVHSISELML